MNCVLAVPIRSGVRVLGVMLTINKGINDVFTDRDKTSVEVCLILISSLNSSILHYIGFVYFTHNADISDESANLLHC